MPRAETETGEVEPEGVGAPLEGCSRWLLFVAAVLLLAARRFRPRGARCALTLPWMQGARPRARRRTRLPWRTRRGRRRCEGLNPQPELCCLLPRDMTDVFSGLEGDDLGGRFRKEEAPAAKSEAERLRELDIRLCLTPAPLKIASASLPRIRVALRTRRRTDRLPLVRFAVGGVERRRYCHALAASMSSGAQAQALARMQEANPLFISNLHKVCACQHQMFANRQRSATARPAAAYIPGPSSSSMAM